MALVSRGGSSSNPSPALFALFSLLSIIEERVESLADEELALIASRFTCFHTNCLNWWHGVVKGGWFNYGDPDHFIANCHKMKGKMEASKHDHHSGRRKGKHEYTSGKHKFKGRFDKDGLKQKYLHKAKIKEHAFLASLSDLDHDSDDISSS
jgi:hypothetical protein